MRNMKTMYESNNSEDLGAEYTGLLLNFNNDELLKVFDYCKQRTSCHYAPFDEKV